MRKFVFSAITVLIVFITPVAVSAGSDCCSYHGGVCGCGCCDGTSLSLACVPYYSACSGGWAIQQAPLELSTNIPTPLLTQISKPTVTLTVTPSAISNFTGAPLHTENVLGIQADTPTPMVASANSKSRSAGGIIGFLLLAGGSYFLYKKGLFRFSILQEPKG